MTTVVKHLPESSAAPWLGDDAYRPPGWRTPLSPRDVAARIAEIDAKRDGPDWTDSKLAKEKARLEEHITMLRQTWITRAVVWRLAERLIGPPEVDPFWNPWSHVHELWPGVRLLDGNEGRDGFDLSLWGRVKSRGGVHGQMVTEEDVERGRTAYVNGPHGETTRYVSLAVRAAAAGHRVAAVVSLDGCSWFAGATEVVNADGIDGVDPEIVQVRTDVASCDVLAIPEGRRMSFEPPPGVKASSPNKGYALALWGVSQDVLDRLWPDRTSGAVRVTIDGDPWVLMLGCGDGYDTVRTVTL